jgi:hypothetical protein
LGCFSSTLCSSASWGSSSLTAPSMAGNAPTTTTPLHPTPRPSVWGWPNPFKSASGLASPFSHLCRDLGSPLPHLHRDSLGLSRGLRCSAATGTTATARSRWRCRRATTKCAARSGGNAPSTRWYALTRAAGSSATDADRSAAEPGL